MDNTIKLNLYHTLCRLGLAKSSFEFITRELMRSTIHNMAEELMTGSALMTLMEATKDEKK